MTLTIVCGMADEARLARECLAGHTILSGTAKFSLDTLVPADTTHIVSWGLCGGLRDRIGIGAVMLATRVLDEAGNNWEADAEWIRRLRARAPWAGACRWFSGRKPDVGVTRAQRQELLRQYGAWCDDDESYYVARYAQARKIPFCVLRSVSDTADMDLPPATLGQAMNPDGSPNMAYILGSLAQDPEQIPMMIELAVDYGKCLGTLKQATLAIGGDFGVQG